MHLFEDLRRRQADWYTANPWDHLSLEQKAVLAQQQGITIDELHTAMTTPHVEMTCPLCGRPSTHVVTCKGCGGGSWGFEMELAHGPDVTERLRTGLAVTLQTQATPLKQAWDSEQIKYATDHVYQSGGCMICGDCWHHTLPTPAYQICPLYLHAERVLNTDQPIPFQSLLFGTLQGEQPHEWVKRIFAHWATHWNTAGQTVGESEAIAHWRATILHGALGRPEEFLKRTVDARIEITKLMRDLGIDETRNE